MIHERGKNALIQEQGYQMGSVEEMELVVRNICSKNANSHGGNTYIPWGINPAGDLISSLDAHVTQGGLCSRCSRVLENKTRGEDCVKCSDLMHLMR